MTHIFNMHKAKSSLSKLVALVEAGEEVQIARNGVPVAELSLPVVKDRPLFGEFAPFVFDIPEDFDIPSEEEVEIWEDWSTKFDYLIGETEKHEKRLA